MGHIAFAAPGIDHFHLHERLRRELQQNGHTVSVLCVDPIAHTFWRHQGGSVSMVHEGRLDAMRAPLAELAARECRRRGCSPHHPRYRREHERCHRRLGRLLPGLVHWLEAQRPDLVVLHQNRTAEHGLVQFIARETGTRVLWTGDGLLPHTLQFDERGLDGDAAAAQRQIGDYRVVRSEPSLLDACLTNLLARTEPSALVPREIVIPPLYERCADAARATIAGSWRGAVGSLAGWRRAMPPPPGHDRPPAQLPASPFVTLLLQDRGDDRLRLDTDTPATERELIVAAASATALLDPRANLVVVLPPRGLDHRQWTGLRPAVQVYFAAAHAAPEAAATALATITVNHPAASGALLAGTPVVHTGRALYGKRGVTWSTTIAAMADTLRLAVGKDHKVLRQRFLSWLFGHGHIWCSSRHPDHNGLAGLVQAIESRLQARSPLGLRLQYRPGPAWPLAAEGRGH